MSRSSSKTNAAGWACLLTVAAVVVWGDGRCAFAESRRKASADACLSDPVCFGLYEEARRLSKSGDLQAAVVAYQAAYRRQPMPWLLINLGRTLHKLGRPQEALSHYQRYTSAEPSGPVDRQQMVRDYTAQAEKAIAEKSAADKPTLELLVDATAAPMEEPPPPPLLVPPVTPPVAPPEKPPVVVVPEPLPVEEPPVRKEPGMPAYFWAGAGAGGALLVAGAITGGVTLGQSSSLQETAFASPAFEALLDQQARIRTLAATTDALLVVGGVTLSAVTVAALVQRYRQRTKQAVKKPAVRPAAGLGLGMGQGLGGRVGRF